MDNRKDPFPFRVPAVQRICDAGAAVSRSQARRMIRQGVVRIDGVELDDVSAEVLSESSVEVRHRGKWVGPTG